MESNAPNLDGMAPEELREWTVRHRKMNREMAAKLFPSRPQRFIRAARDLVNYAWNKHTAVLCRQRGDVNTALIYEGICDRIYQGLPEYARW